MQLCSCPSARRPRPSDGSNGRRSASFGFREPNFTRRQNASVISPPSTKQWTCIHREEIHAFNRPSPLDRGSEQNGTRAIFKRHTANAFERRFEEPFTG